MSDGILFIGWGSAQPGREQVALRVFSEAVGYWNSLKESGRIESFDAFALEPHGGDLAGFCILRGDRETLAQVRISAEFQRINARAQMAVEDFGVVGGVTGGEMQRLFEMFQEQLQDLGS